MESVCVVTSFCIRHVSVQPGTFAGARALRRIGTSTMRLNTVNLTFTVAELETAFNHRNRGGNANQWKCVVVGVKLSSAWRL